MQIINNIEIVCSICGKNLPVEAAVGFEPDSNRWIYRVFPCVFCSHQENTPDGDGGGVCEHMSKDGHFCTHVGDVVQ